MGQTNMLFGDGHVQAVSFPALQTGYHHDLRSASKAPLEIYRREDYKVSY